MTVQQVHRKLGQFSVRLKADAPPGIVAALEWFGHIAIAPGRLSPEERGDEMLTLARYVGILRTTKDGEQTTLSGIGMAGWLGDEDGKGDVIEPPGITYTAATFADAIRAVLPAGGAITEGTIYSGIPGTLSNTHLWQTPRAALDYICDTMGGEWVVRGNGTCDAGPASSLFRTTPEAVIVRRGAGYDVALKALPGELESTRSAKDTTTRVVVVAAGLAAGDADVASTPYKDLHGGTVRFTRVVDEQDETSVANADARAQAILNLWSGTRRSLRLSVSDFDVAGDVQPGDVVWCYDPDAGIADPANEIPFRGGLIYPMPVRVLGLTWPITVGHTVGYRSGTGVWTDLTPWVDWEPPGGGEVEVGDSIATQLTPSVGGLVTQVSGGGGGAGDPAVPDVPVFGTFTTSSYQPGDGLARAAIQVTWTQPLNTDSSTIVDGDHYELRHRVTGAADWQVSFAGFDETSMMVTDLSPATTYDFQIRAVDYASPINQGAWSATMSFLSASDTTAPATPAPGTLAASLIAFQLTHTLGLASGGTYNLPLDLDHLKVYVGSSSGFTAGPSNLVGKLPANAAMIIGGIPAVGTFPLASTGAVWVRVGAVDRTGNESTASSAVSVTATLIDSAHISDLTASKLTAGTVTAALLLAGSIKTGTVGARGEFDTAGLRAYNPGGTATVDVNFTTGEASITGAFRTSTSGQRITVDASGTYPTIYLYDNVGSSNYAYINSPGTGLGMNSGYAAAANAEDVYSRAFLNPLYAALEVVELGTQALHGGQCYVGETKAELSAFSTSSAKRAMVQADAAPVLTSQVFASNGTTLLSEVRLNATEANVKLLNTSSQELAALTMNSTDVILARNTTGTTTARILLNSSDAQMMSYSGGSENGRFITGGSEAYLAWYGTGSIKSRITADGSTARLEGYSGGSQVSKVFCDSTRAKLEHTASNNSFQANSTGPYIFGVVAPGGTPTAIGVDAGLVRFMASSARFKAGITAIDLDPDDVLAVRPVTYAWQADIDEGKATLADARRHLGLIAEEVAETPLGDLLVARDEDGRPFSVHYDRLAVASTAVLRDHRDRIARLEAVIELAGL